MFLNQGGEIVGKKSGFQWYPMFGSQIENEDFRKLSPTGKLYYWYLSNRFSRYNADVGEFFHSDEMFAVALGVETVTIRKIRPKLKKLGFIDYTPGFKNDQDRPVATKYHYVRWSDVSEREEDDYFVRHRRYSLEMLLANLRRGIFSAPDIVVYVYLEHFKDKFHNKNNKNSFYISKKDLRHYSNIKDAVIRIENLYKNYRYANGAPLFEYKDEYHRISFDSWAVPLEPIEDPGGNNYEQYEEEIYDLYLDSKYG